MDMPNKSFECKDCGIMENYHYYPSNYCNYCEDVMSNVSSDEHENEKNEESPERIEESPERIEESPERIEESPERIEESPERIEKSPERIEESPDFQLVRDSSIGNGFPPEKDNNSTKMDTENSPPSVSQPVIPRFKFKKTAGKVTSSEDTSDTSKSSKEKCSDSFKSAEGGFECPKHILESSSEERVTKQNDEEKSSDDSESIRFIPPKLKSCSAKVEYLSNKDDQTKQQHQEDQYESGIQCDDPSPSFSNDGGVLQRVHDSESIRLSSSFTEKYGDDSESIRFIPPRSKSGSAKKVEHFSNKDDLIKEQHQEDQYGSGIQCTVVQCDDPSPSFSDDDGALQIVHDSESIQLSSSFAEVSNKDYQEKQQHQKDQFGTGKHDTNPNFSDDDGELFGELTLQVDAVQNKSGSLKIHVKVDPMYVLERKRKHQQDVFRASKIKTTDVQETSHGSAGLNETTKSWLCEFCKKDFSSQTDLKMHVSRIHEDQKELFERVSSSHEGAELYQTTEETDSEKSQIDQKNESIICGKKPFKCIICDTTFAYKKDLNEHKAQNHEIAVPYNCDVCKSGFWRKQELFEHVLTSHEGKGAELYQTTEETDLEKSQIDQKNETITYGKKPLLDMGGMDPKVLQNRMGLKPKSLQNLENMDPRTIQAIGLQTMGNLDPQALAANKSGFGVLGTCHNSINTTSNTIKMGVSGGVPGGVPWGLPWGLPWGAPRYNPPPIITSLGPPPGIPGNLGPPAGRLAFGVPLVPQGMGPPHGLPPLGLPPLGLPRHGLPSLGLPRHGLPPHGLPPHGLPPHGLPPHGLPPHGLPPLGLTPLGLPPHGLPPHGLPSHGLPPHGLPQHGLPPHTMGPLMFGQQQMMGPMRPGMGTPILALPPNFRGGPLPPGFPGHLN